MTAEEDYRRDVAAIRRDHPAGPERDSRKARRWERYEADLFERDGNLTIVYRLQQLFATRYHFALKDFYNREIDEEAYKKRRVEALRKYARQLFNLGLLVGVFDNEWIFDFANNSLAVEREVIPAPEPGPPITEGDPKYFTNADADPFCDPLRDFSKRFFHRLHIEFGVGRLKRHPEIYGGVDSTLFDAEARYVVAPDAPGNGSRP